MKVSDTFTILDFRLSLSIPCPVCLSIKDSKRLCKSGFVEPNHEELLIFWKIDAYIYNQISCYQPSKPNNFASQLKVLISEVL